MNWLSLEEYKDLFGEIEEKDWKRYSVKAELFLISRTTTIDGVMKLKEYFPVEHVDVLSVKLAVGELVNAYRMIDQFTKNQEAMSGVITSEEGVRPKQIESLTAGSETIKFSNDQSGHWVSEVSKSKEAQLAYLDWIVLGNLEGARDRNGVNLLYLGQYPRGCRR